MENETDYGNYYALIVAKSDASEEFLELQTDDSIKTYGKKLSDANSVIVFTKYFDGSEKELESNTGYNILIVRDKKIFYSYGVTTAPKTYVNGINISTGVSDMTFRYLLINVEMEKSFTAYKSIYCELYNKDTKLTYFAIIDKDNVDTSYASYPILVWQGQNRYEFRVYINPDNPDDIDYTETVTKDEITYYLVYTHSEEIKY